jgi:hypothetical protein
MKWKYCSAHSRCYVTTARWGGYTKAVSGKRLVKHVPIARQQIINNARDTTMEELCSPCGPCRDVISKGEDQLIVLTRVKAGSNTSIVTLRVVGGDEKEVSNLRQQNMVSSSKGLGPGKDCAGKGQQHIKKTDPSSRQRERPA